MEVAHDFEILAIFCENMGMGEKLQARLKKRADTSQETTGPSCKIPPPRPAFMPFRYFYDTHIAPFPKLLDCWENIKTILYQASDIFKKLSIENILWWNAFRKLSKKMFR